MMIRGVRSFFILAFACTLPQVSFAQAPVVDDSANFTILEEKAGSNQPASKSSIDVSDGEQDEVPLVKDDSANADGPIHASEKGGKSNGDLFAKVQSLQQEVQELRGQLEVQSHDLKLLQQQQLTFYKDLDARLRNVPATQSAQKNEPSAASIAEEKPEKISASEPLNNRNESKSVEQFTDKKANSIAEIKPVSQPSNRAAPGNPADEQISYLAAYELIKNKHFDEALKAMHTFVKKYPQGGYTANAQYWLGELYLTKHQYPKAINHFEIVMKQFPSSSKSSASMLKSAYALAAMGQVDDAKQRLQQVIKNYPGSSSAQLAAAKMASIKG